jgi:hypothetical protein
MSSIRCACLCVGSSEVDRLKWIRRNRIHFMLRGRNAYGLKYVEIDEYTSEKRE